MHRLTALDRRAKAAALITVILLASYIAGTLYMSGWPASTTSPGPVERYVAGKKQQALPQQSSAEKGVSPSSPASPAAGGTASEPLEPPTRKIVYTASVTLEAGDVVDAAKSVEEVASRLGGYVSWESISTGKKPRAVVTVKVPVEHYGEALEEIKSIGRLLSVSQKAEDVTDRYVDLQARLRNLKAEEQRLLDLLGKARSISEIIQVEDRLRIVRTQIEYIEAMLKNLERRVDYATITVTITGPEEQPLPTLDWGRVLRDALETAYRVVAGLVILIIGFSPIWIILAAAYILFKSMRSQASSRAQGESRQAAQP